MIPKFPQFKPLEISDQAEVESYTNKYLPYSDFDFETMWCWDTEASARISNLNGNLVLLTQDIHSSDIVCSYLGHHRLANTLSQLFEFLDETGILKPRLSLVPELSLEGLNFNKYYIEFDLNSCDYVYDIDQLAGYAGNQYLQKRGRTNNFIRNYPNVEVKVLNLNDKQIRSEILGLNNSWVKNKTKHHTDSSMDKEEQAIQKFLDANFKDTYCIGIYHESGLIGFAIFTFHNHDYVVNHFFKADISYKGVNEFLMRECASLLKARNCKFLNFQEDMGLPGLRQAKLTYRPITFLRKYFVNRL